MYAYRTPGVYFEWIDVQPPSVLPLRTDITGFVGIAERGPLHTPVKVESWPQFTGMFGVHIPQAFLAYAVQGFFENGGRTCWVVRVADPDAARPAAAEWGEPLSSGQLGKPLFQLLARSPGSWGMRLLCSVVRVGANRISLTLRLPDGAREQWNDLRLDRNDPRFIERVINEERAGSRLVTVIVPDDSPLLVDDPRTRVFGLQEGAKYLTGGEDGLATLRTEHFSGETSPPDKPWGLAALASIDEVSIVTMPDMMPKPVVNPPIPKPRPRRCDVLDGESSLPPVPETPLEFPPQFNEQEIGRLQTSLIQQCELLKDRFAILDSLNPPEVEAVMAWVRDFSSKFAAIYHPWVLMRDPLELEGLLRVVPASGHVAGIYARSDQRIGVHKPPANEVVNAVSDVRWQIDDARHGVLNERGINVIRSFNGRGIRVAGARTLSSDTEWRYVNVRRLMTMIEEAIDESTQWTVFEPNNRDLWRDIDRVVRGFLDGLWRRGMLDGATAEEAYFVRCDETTNPPEETEAGRVICLIGVQPPWPAEFVVIRIGKTQGATEIFELTGGRNA